MSAIDNRQDIIAVVNGHPVLIPVGPETVVSEAQDLAVKAAGYDDLPGLWETRTGHGHLLSQDARLDAPYDCSCTG